MIKIVLVDGTFIVVDGKEKFSQVCELIEYLEALPVSATIQFDYMAMHRLLAYFEASST